MKSLVHLILERFYFIINIRIWLTVGLGSAHFSLVNNRKLGTQIKAVAIKVICEIEKCNAFKNEILLFQKHFYKTKLIGISAFLI